MRSELCQQRYLAGMLCALLLLSGSSWPASTPDAKPLTAILLVARDDHGLRAAAREEEIAVAGELASMADEVPRRGEDALQLALENRVAGEGFAAQRSAIDSNEIGDFHMLCTV